MKATLLQLLSRQSHSSVLSDVPTYRQGRGRTIHTLPQSEVNTTIWSRREVSPHLTQVGEDRNELKNILGDWTAFANKTKAEAIHQRKEWRNFQSKIFNTHNQSTYVEDAVTGMLQ